MVSKFFAKGTLLIPSGPTHDPNRAHLQVICNNACIDGNHLLVSICTYKNSLCDSTCILNADDHPLINRRSYVSYRHAQIRSSSQISGGIESGEFTIQQNFTQYHFLKIRNGIDKSQYTPRKIKKYYTQFVKPT